MSALCSIIIPVFNRAGLTRRCLEKILAEPPEASFEIVVVDDGSTDSTPALLSEYGRKIRVVTHAVNRGYATSCNDGAAASNGQFLIFLNNDTEPKKGWLDALVSYAVEHPKAAVIGSKLLFPDDTVQHAGVVITYLGSPRHIYAGFPADHPAVNKSRRFQCVTFASALVRRPVFEALGGLETAFRNCYEDVDFCFRLNREGHEAHYCHKSVVYHLESVSRGRRSEDDAHNGRLLNRKWFDRPDPIESDDLRYYQEDSLLKVVYPDTYPLRFGISPLLAFDSRPGAAEEKDVLLKNRTRQVFRLLQETIRLTAYLTELELANERNGPAKRPAAKTDDANRSRNADELVARAEIIEDEIYRLQAELAATLGDSSGGVSPPAPPFEPNPFLGYGTMLRRIREVVRRTLPEEATVAVVTDGNDDLLELEGRPALHFPQNEEGVYNGFPLSGEEAISCLEAVRERGAQYLVLPIMSLWWLEHYARFHQYLLQNCPMVLRQMDACVIFALTPAAAEEVLGSSGPSPADQQDVLSQVEQAMKRDWNERARENAMYYVASGHADWDRVEFFESGKINTSQLILKDLDTIRRGLDPKQMVALEIGCGVGRMTRHLADIFGQVEAVDVSREMIAQARRNLADQANVGLHETSGSDLAPFPDGLFDFCFSYIVFQHIPFREAIVKYIEEVHRTLKQDRLFKFQVHGGLRVRLSAAQADQPKMRVGTDGTALEEVDTWHGVAFSEEEMRELADRIGFEILQMEGQDSQYFWNWWVRK